MDSNTWKVFRVWSVFVWALFIVGMILVGSNAWIIAGVLALAMDLAIGYYYAKHLENLEEIEALEELDDWEDKYDEDEDDGFDRDLI